MAFSASADQFVSGYPGPVSAIHVAVSDFLRDHEISRSNPVLVAVSAGADSVALLYALVALGQRVHVGHVHHGLRSDADRDREFVAELADQLGLGFDCQRVDARKRAGESPEGRARELRYLALEEMRQTHGCVATATAHTLDDQAETVLLRQMRGATLSGLAGILPRCADRALIRPLLQVRRAALREYLQTHSYRWREDESNADWSIPRNRLRAQVLPALEEIYPDALAKIASLAAEAQESRRVEDRTADRLLLRAEHPGASGLDRTVLGGLEEGERILALREWLCRAGLATRITRQHLLRASRFSIEAPRGASLSLPGDHELVRSGDRLELRGSSRRSHGARSTRATRPPA